MPLFKIIACCATYALLIGVVTTAKGAEFGDFTYTDHGSYIEITGHAYKTTKHVIIPESIDGKPVTTIGERAFEGNNHLRAIDIPNSITSIGERAFAICTSLESISIPPNVQSIGSRAFHLCMDLSSIHVDSQNVDYASIAGVLFNKNLDTLITYPMDKATRSYTVPDGVTSIAADAFLACHFLKVINIPANVVSIDDNAILACIDLEAINVAPDNSTYASVEGVLFDKTLTTLIAFPEHRTGQYDIPDGVQVIGEYAFDNCIWLTNISMPLSLLTIEDFAFLACKELTQTNIPHQVTSIGDSPFSFCDNLSQIDVSPANGSLASNDGILFNTSMTTMLAYPSGKTKSTYIVPDSVTTIAYHAFSTKRYLNSIYFHSDAPLADLAFYSGFSSATASKVYHFSNKTGFTSPTWNGLTTVSMGPSSPGKIWLIENELPHDSDLCITTNASGKPLLLPYALKLDPDIHDAPQPVVNGNLIEYTFYSGRNDVTYAVETSKDLLNWTSTGIILSDPDAEGYQTATANLDDSQCFVRVTVSAAE
ncbi:leucine-rich repeat domain-containing protein [Rubellicoccus peritrichatus]|uniref:Leucine-rich repeat domain-containing protein n=1 Tax=Rubellicoccus peritrichatus TaxID=3080537 RepID=A0AAQ3QWC3_9BACT|nr:leucine-rich repeat domain-containing protein [Puniceicoccus sp. CR14]WOO41747.1 leucine-rich repeat domain-containing protein [Puniceicoccus sp. CR14]